MKATMNHSQIWITLLVCFALFLGAAIGFGALADEVREGDTASVDQTILRSINERASPELDGVFLVVTEIGGVIGISVITLAALIFLLVKRYYKQATIVFASVAGATLVNIVLKTMFARTRPDLWEQLITETSYSFPSGHAMLSSVVAAVLVALFWRTRYRIAAIVAGLLFMLSISFSRLYLGVHYPTDVLGGWLVGIAWVIIVVSMVDGWLFRRARRLKAMKSGSDSEDGERAV